MGAIRLLVCFVCLPYFGTSAANPCANASVVSGLTAINALRARHGVPMLSCDADMCLGASRWAGVLAGLGGLLMHNMGVPYGENLAAIPWKPEGSIAYVTSAINAWYREIALYNASRPGFNASTGHFTQLVWTASRRLGLGLVTGTFPKNKKGAVVVAWFDPPGNSGGPKGFSKNVRFPFRSSRSK